MILIWVRVLTGYNIARSTEEGIIQQYITILHIGQGEEYHVRNHVPCCIDRALPIHPICHGTENNGTAAPQYLHVFLDYNFQQATPQAQLHCVLNEKTQTWINGMEKLIKQKLQNISIQL